MPGFFEYIDFIFAPFRAVKNKILGVQNVKGNMMVDVNRSKALIGQGKQMAGNANQKMNQWGGHYQQQQQPGQQQQAQQPGAQYMPQQGMPPQGGFPPGGGFPPPPGGGFPPPPGGFPPGMAPPGFPPGMAPPGMAPGMPN